MKRLLLKKRHCERSEAICTLEDCFRQSLRHDGKYLMFLASCLMLLFPSCEKDIELKVPEAEKKLVVEGHIENGKNPYVILTRTASFFQPTDSASLAQMLVLDATVTISDGTTTQSMALGLNFDVFPPIVYTTTAMTGEAGKTYYLTIKTGGETYTASTTIPQPVPLDSVWFRLQGTSDSLGYAWAHLSDPPGLGNAYRWFAKRIGKDQIFIAPLGSAFDDKFIEGKSFDFAYNRGETPNSNKDDDTNEEAGYFKEGDTIVVKFCTIDIPSFEFYRSYEVQASSQGNPFASPINIKSNVSNKAIGIWGGYGVSYDTIIAK